MKFGSCVPGGMVALAALRSVTRASTPGLLAGEPLLQAGAGQYAELDLRPRPPPGQAMFSQLPCLGV